MHFVMELEQVQKKQIATYLQLLIKSLYWPPSQPPRAAGCEAFFCQKKGNLKMKQSKEKQLDQLRKQFHKQTTAPRPETLKHLNVLERQTLDNIVDAKVGELVEQFTDSEPLALGVQLFVRIQRQNPHLKGFVVFAVVLALGNLYSLREEFAQALEDLQLLN